MSLYLPIIAVNRSQSLRIGNSQTGQPGNKVPQELGSDIKASGATSVPYYVDITVAENRKDLQRHSAIGAYVIVGPLTASNVDEVVDYGATASASNLVITVTAGELLTRSSGVYTAVAGGTVTLATADGTQDRTDLVWVKASDGSLGYHKGILAAAGNSVAPTPGIGTAATVSGTTVNANNVVTVASTAGIAVGQAITGTGIPAHDWVTAVTSPTTFTLAYNATASATNTLTLINTVGDSTWLVAATATAATLVADVRPRP